MARQPQIRTGLEVLKASNWQALKGCSFALLGNHCSVGNDGTHLIEYLKQRGLKKLLAPEHGFRGEFQDSVRVPNSFDTASGLPVVSLYKTDEDQQSRMLNDIDAVLIDLPDIGSRYYTYSQTMALVMQQAKHAQVKVIVLDRPNPLGGALVEGVILDHKLRSFSGYGPLTNRHGLTIGELATLMNRGFGVGQNRIEGIEAELEVVPMDAWKRSMQFSDTGLSWISPSPNMPSTDTALVYVGTCLFEASEISEGRGTVIPFEQIGAPDIDAKQWLEATKAEKIDFGGVELFPVSFTPKFGKHVGSECRGIRIRVTDKESFRPLRLGSALLSSISKLDPGSLSLKLPKSNKAFPLDYLFGTPSLRNILSSKQSASTLISELERSETAFQAARTPFLLYP